VGTISDAGHEGDRQGWAGFLDSAQNVFQEHGDVPFVHWHHYERVRLDMYIQRFGDPKRIARRIRRNLLDLLPVTQSSVALPLPSYSLKVVEKYVGFRRTLEEANGDWAMATYIEATETEDEERRTELYQRVLDYNREDLAATWAVLSWLRSRSNP
jgi:predicted RecB family nuclease